MSNQDESSAELIKVTSTRFSDFEVSPSSVITIIGGIIGFTGPSRYVLLDYNPPFSWLHSVEKANLAFVVVNAAEFGENYIFPLPFGDLELQLTEDDDVAILNVVSVRPNPQDTTVNLKAPIVVNLRNRKARQIVLDDPTLSVRFPLWSKEEGKEAPKESPKD